MLYAALGDSITYGYTAGDENSRYVARIQSSLSKQQAVNVFLHAKPGWTSKQLLKSAERVPDVIWAEARLITILIGGNDLLRAVPWLIEGNTARIMRIAEKVRDNVAELVHLIKRPHSTILLATLYNPFPNSLLAEEYTEAINKSLRMIAQREKVHLADVRKHFFRRESEFIDGYRHGKLRDMRIRGNPIHPNDTGHEAIAQVFLRTYRRTATNARVTRAKAKASR